MNLTMPWRAKPRNLTASAESITPGDSRRIKLVAHARQSWQVPALTFFDKLAEVHYPAMFSGNTVGRFEYPVALRPENDPHGDPVVPPDSQRDELFKAAQGLMAQLEGSLGGIDELARLFTINDMVTGEGYLVGEQMGDVIDWEYLSVKELVPNDADETRWVRRRLGIEATSDEFYNPFVKRVWNAHFATTFLADSPLRALGDDCQRLIALNQSMTARIINRLAQSGILFLPNGLSIIGQADDTPDGTNQSRDPFWVAFLNKLEKAVLHQDLASGAVPLMVRGEREDGDAIKHIVMDRTIDRVEMELRAELRNNIAQGQDLPPEAQQGLGDANHFSAWSITDSTYQNHLLPKARTWANAVTRTYLWPALRLLSAERGLNVPESEIRRYVIWPDGAHVVSKPNANEDARQIRDRFGISDDYLRQIGGIPDEAKPSEEEYVRQIGQKINHPYLSTFGLKVQNKIDWEKVAATPAGEGAPGAGSTPPSRRPADSSDPKGAPGPDKTKKTQADAQTIALIANGHLAAARNYVGARLRARAASSPDVLAEIKTAKNEEVLGRIELDDIDTGVGEVEAMFTSALKGLRSDLAEILPDDHAEAYVRALSLCATQRAVTPPNLFTLRSLAEGVLGDPEF